MRRWRFVVTAQGGDQPLSEVVVEGGNWLGALQAAQQALREPGGVPAGASCAVAPDEHVAIHDPGTRRSFYLAPESSSAFQAPHRAAPSVASGVPPAPQPPKPRKLAQTMAYNINDLMPPGGAPPAKPAGAEKAGRRTMAYNVADLGLPVPVPGGPGGKGGPAGKEVVVGRPSAPSTPPRRPAPSRPSMPAQPSAPPPRPKDHGAVLSARDAEPTKDSPLRYRERTYYVHPGTSEEAALSLLKSRFSALKRELDALPPGKYVNLAAFDHAWTGEPNGPPIVTLQWMDWRGDPEIGYPARSG